MYTEFLSEIYRLNSNLYNETYKDQLEFLLDHTSDIVGSHVRAFRKMGLDASCIIVNANSLQKTWRKENEFNLLNSFELVYNQVKKYKPDVLFIYSREFLSHYWISQIRQSISQIKLIIGSHCAPYYEKNIKDFKNLDFMLTCTPGLNNDFKKYGIKSYLLYHGFDIDLNNRIKRVDCKDKLDIAFSGSLFLGGGFHNTRLKYIEGILDSGINMEVYANIEDKFRIFLKQMLFKTNKISKRIGVNGFLNKLSFFKDYSDFLETPVHNYSEKLMKKIKHPVFGLKMYELISRTKIIFNIHGDIANQYAGNVRLFEATGLGACLLTDNKINIGDLFVPGKEIVVYDGINDCIEKIKWLLDNDSKRIEIAKAGQERTLKTHTIEHRCNDLIDIIEKELKN